VENWLRACDFQRNEAGCNEHTYSEECAEHRALSVPRDCGCDCYVKIAVRRRAGERRTEQPVGGAGTQKGRRRRHGPWTSRAGHCRGVGRFQGVVRSRA